MLFNGNDSYYFHEMAVKFKERYGVEEFSGLVQGRGPYKFLKNQKDISYKHLGLFQDIFNDYKHEEIEYDYLDKIEKEYGNPFLWLFVYPERNVIFDRDISVYMNSFQKYTHEDILKLLQVFFKYIVNIVEELSPDYIIMDNVSSMPHYILYSVAKKNNIPTLMLSYTRISNLYIVGDNPFDEFNKIFEIYKRIRKGEYKSPFEKKAKDFLGEYRKSHIKPEYLEALEKKDKKFFSIRHQLWRMGRILHYAKEYYIGDYKDDYVFKNKHPFRATYEEFKKLARKKIYRIEGLFEKPNYNEKYVFFPLHFDPELATTVMAPFYVNQLHVIEAIAKSMPVTYKLYVKDHPRMYAKGLRPIRFYKKLLEIPNVKLIDPAMNSYEIIKHCQLVITITGTAGWEALLLKKPVITFGKPIYSRLSMVKKVGDFEKLPYLIEDMLNNYVYDEEEVVAFISAIMEASFPLDRSSLLEASNLPLDKCLTFLRTHPELEKLVNAFASEMGMKN
jgi:hypothetical protein